MLAMAILTSVAVSWGRPGIAAAQTPAVPIGQQDPAAVLLPLFIGSPATPHPFYEPPPPQNPYMAANGSSEIHDDGYQSDTYQTSGPLGHETRVLSTQVNAECASVTFDRLGRIISVCVGATGPTLYMFDPATLATLATFSLPPKQPSTGSVNPFTNFNGGGYFYLDKQDRAVIPTTNRHIYVVGEGAGPSFHLVHDYDVSSTLPSTDQITSALPDWAGRIFFESFGGVLGTINPATTAVHTLALHEETENSFAVDEHHGVYVVSTQALYRLHAAPSGAPVIDWRSTYPNSGIHEPGQIDAGSGSTPTVQGAYVTITDNANPIDVVVYRRDTGRRICVQPVFTSGHSADENSIIGAGNLMIVENNYGYTGPAAVENGGVTAPGLERVDINANGQGCHVVWSNDSERVPSLVSKVSLANGLLYSYTKDDTSQSDAWYFTALDATTGRVIYKQLTGTGLGYNNNYAPVTIAPDGAAYVGTIGGLVELRDAVAPSLPPPVAPSPPAQTRPPTPHPSRCPRATGKLSGTRLGLIRLEMTRSQARRAYAHSSNRSKRYEDFFCLTPTGIRVGYASPKLLRTLPKRQQERLEDRVVWASTSNRYYAIRGIRPGAKITTASHTLQTGTPFHVGLNLWYLAPNGRSTAVLKVRHGIVAEIGIADHPLTRNRQARLTFLRSFS